MYELYYASKCTSFKYIYAYAWDYKVVYINKQNLEKIQLNSTIEVQFCVMCHKLFIFIESFIF